MNASGFILKAANMLVTLVVAIVFLLTGAYAAYALWDNNTVYAAASNVQAEMIRLKPVVQVDEATDVFSASFEELLAINQDVRGWITMDGTNIDFPILQGATNLSYINTDVYGNFALAGSIFLDSRSDGAFLDPYSLVYGHDMVEGKMFGDLSKYKDEAFFRANRTGSLILPDRAYDLKIYAVLVLQASNDMIFDPELHGDGLSELLDYTKEQALFIHPEMAGELESASADKEVQMISLTTCSAEFTDARTIILAVMEPSTPAK